MEDLMQQIMPYVISILGVCLTYVSFRVGKLVNRAMEKYEVYDTLKANQVIVKASVEYVEQVFSSLDGKEKFELAKEQSLKIMNEKGLQVSENELDALIEQAVFSFKKGMKDKNKAVVVEQGKVENDVK